MIEKSKIEKVGNSLIEEGKVRDLDTLFEFLDELGVSQDSSVAYQLKTANLI